MLRFAAKPARPRRGFSAHAAHARRRADFGATRPRPDGRRSPIRYRALSAIPPPPRSGDDWTGFVATLADICAQTRPAGLPRSNARAAGMSRSSNAFTKTPRPVWPTCCNSNRSPRGYPLARAVPHRIDARPAGRDQRSGRRAAARRGLSDPIDDPFRQGTGMEVGLRPQRRRRLHPVRSRRRHDGGNRRGAPAALCRDDAGEGQICTSSCRSASSPMASMPRAIATSTPREPASFRRRLLHHFECVTWPLATTEAGVQHGARQVRVDVGARMRGMWR